MSSNSNANANANANASGVSDTTASTDLKDFSEFESAPTSRQLDLPAYEVGVPEAMNNYSLPPDADLIASKQQLLWDQFPTFANKSADDLEDLLRYADLFQAHIDGLEQIQLMRTLEYELREENERLAKVNLSSEDELKRMREGVAELQMFASSLTTRLYELVQEHLDLQKPYSPAVLLARAKREAREADEEAERRAEGFLDKGVDEIEDFVRAYKAMRARFHSLDSRHKMADAAYRSGDLAGVPMAVDR
ncbi:hypothetical protein LPJ66_003914 [Kickxella alabastrina]|uniref:Uncharacterized protein n=1 Tax=Kickxella alabastrina TaxID=61397 RepID=A0ACC1IIR5_9FUNG|nr:hypothetical protein LPJ66_003914 [Kickxella alabastrina]